MTVKKPNLWARGRSMATAFGGAIVMVAALAGATLIAQPLTGSVPAGTDVSVADAPGINRLEPAPAAPAAAGAPGANGERVVTDWTPTGGGAGGGPVAPSKTPKTIVIKNGKIEIEPVVYLPTGHGAGGHASPAK